MKGKMRKNQTKKQTSSLASGQSSKDSNDATTLSGSENLGLYSLKAVYVFKSPNFV